MAAPGNFLEAFEGASPMGVAQLLRESFADVLFELRQPGAACATLPMCSWSLLVAILACTAREDQSPALSLAHLSGLSGRAVRKHLNVLQEAELVDPPRRGTVRCLPGRVLRAELQRLGEGVGKTAPYADPAPRAAPAPGAASSPLLKTKKNKLISSSSFLKDAPPLAPGLTAPATTTEEEGIAQEALSSLYRRKHPSAPVPSTFRPDEIALVIQCTRECDGDLEEKRAIHRHAVRGAFLVSRGGPPTARFVWGRMDHFLAHVARGRAEAARTVSARTRPTPEEQPVPLHANREGWAKLRDILGGSAPSMPRERQPFPAPLGDENEESTLPQK